MSPIGVNGTALSDPLYRLATIFDQDSTCVRGRAPKNEVLWAEGLILGEPVIAFASNPGAAGGALGADASAEIVSAVNTAMAKSRPIIGVWHSGGARLQEGCASLDAIGRMFAAFVAASGRIPQVSVVLGPAAGGAAYGPALTDFVIAGPEAKVFVTGPDIVRRSTGEVLDGRALGGPEQHAVVSGVVHVTSPTDQDALTTARELVELLSTGVQKVSAPVQPDPDISSILPASRRHVYDMHKIVQCLLDRDSPRVELHERWAPNLVTILGRMEGLTVGILANNPLHLVGCLDCAASEKAARFVRTCDALGVPLVVLVDVPGYLPGSEQENLGIVRHGAKLLHAFAEAVVPRTTVILRKAFGGAFVAMNSKSLGATAVYAWPTAEVGIMDPFLAVEILYRRTLGEVAPQKRPALLAQLAAEYQDTVGSVERAVETELHRPDYRTRRHQAPMCSIFGCE